MTETQTVVYTEQQITEAIDEVSNDHLGTVSAIKSKDALAAYKYLIHSVYSYFTRRGMSRPDSIKATTQIFNEAHPTITVA